MTEKNNFSNEQPKQQQVKVSLTQEVAKGQYANLMLKFFKRRIYIRFWNAFSTNASAMIHSRIVLTPRNTKKLLSLLQTQVQEYEKNVAQFQTIKIQLAR